MQDTTIVSVNVLTPVMVAWRGDGDACGERAMYMDLLAERVYGSGFEDETDTDVGRVLVDTIREKKRGMASSPQEALAEASRRIRSRKHG